MERVDLTQVTVTNLLDVIEKTQNQGIASLTPEEMNLMDENTLAGVVKFDHPEDVV
jgi:hypothetical protein